MSKPKTRQVSLQNRDKAKLTQAKRVVNASRDQIIAAIKATSGFPADVARHLGVETATVVVWMRTIPEVAMAARLRLMDRRQGIVQDVLHTAERPSSKLRANDHLAYQKYAVDLLRQEEADLLAMLPKDKGPQESYSFTFHADAPAEDAAPDAADLPPDAEPEP